MNAIGIVKVDIVCDQEGNNLCEIGINLHTLNIRFWGFVTNNCFTIVNVNYSKGVIRYSHSDLP